MTQVIKRILPINASANNTDDNNNYNQEFDYLLSNSSLPENDVSGDSSNSENKNGARISKRLVSDNNDKDDIDFNYLLSSTIIREKSVFAISFSPDNKKIAIGGHDNKATIFDTYTGREIVSFPRDGWIRTLSFSPDSKKLAVAGFDRKVNIYSISSRRKVQVFRRSRWILSVAFSYDGKKLAVGGQDGMAVVYSVKSGELLHSFQQNDWVWAVTFSHNGKNLIVGGQNSKTTIYKLKNDKKVRAFEMEDNVNAIAISSDDTKLAVAGDNKKVVIYDLKTGIELKTFQYENWVVSVAFSPYGSKIIAGDYDGNVRIYDVSNGNKLKSFQCTGGVEAVGFSPDGKKVAFGGYDDKVQIFHSPGEDPILFGNSCCEMGGLGDNGPSFCNESCAGDDIFEISIKTKSASLKPSSNENKAIKIQDEFLNNSGVKDIVMRDIIICFIRQDRNKDIDGTRATVFVKADEQNCTKLSDALKLVPESSGLFQMDPEAVKFEHMLRVVVKDDFFLQADQCNITIEELRERFSLNFEISLGIRFDCKTSFKKYTLPF